MALQPIDQLEKKLDAVELGALEVSDSGITYRVLSDAIAFGKMMAATKLGMPPHLRGQEGACIRITLQALDWRVSAFWLADESYIVNDRIAYGAKLIHAIVLKRAPLQRRLRINYEGEGQDRVCIVSGLLKGEVDPLEYRSPKIRDIKVKNSPLWTGDPDQQLAYFSVRAWARRFVPDVLGAVYSDDELAGIRADREHVGADHAKDVTPPKSKLAERLKGGAGKPGFSKEHVDRETGGSSAKALTHDTSAVDMTPAADAKPAEEKVAVETAGGEQQAAPAQAQAEQPAAPAETAEPAQEQAESDAGTEEDLRPQAFDAGVEAKNKNRPLHSVPDIYAGNPVLSEAYKDGWRLRDKQLSEMETA